MELKLQEQDGLVFDVFHYLWLKNPMTKAAPMLNIPPIIQFRAGQAKFWYFSKNGQVLRKRKEKLDPEYLKSYFQKEDSSQIAAVWITKVSEQVVFRYLSQMELNVFMEQINYKVNGYLQTFLYPSGQRNSIIKCLWQENHCLFELYQNTNNINDPRLTINQRVATFEVAFGPITQNGLKSEVIQSKLETIAQSIVEHIFDVSYQKIEITYLELYFKQTKNGDLTLLYCTQVKSKYRSPNFKTEQSRKKTRIKLTNCKLSQPLLSGPNNRAIQTQKCLGCQNQQNVNLFEEVSLKSIIRSWDQHHQFDCKQQAPIIEIDKDWLIPKIIRFLYPKMEFSEYVELKGNVGFTAEIISICLTCFMKIQRDPNRFNKVNINPLLHRKGSTMSSMLNSNVQSQVNFHIKTFDQTPQRQMKSTSNSQKRSLSQLSVLYRTRCSTYIAQNISEMIQAKEIRAND